MSKLMPAQATMLIVSFALNQSRITKEANTKRGVTKKSKKEERKLISQLFTGLTGWPPRNQYIDSIIENIS